MKKTSLFFLCLMFTFSAFAQIPPFVDVQEWKVKDQENVPIEIDGQPPQLRPSSVMGMPVMLEIISQRLAGLDTGLKNMAEETGIIFPKQGNVFNDGPHIDINDGDTNSDFNKNPEFILNDSK